ncbi:MAG TPA: SLC13 family permease [Sporichthyaceae bacterium]|jgi:arsenical pump membrane protein|nr:SLC13 family permease [Sporichthyaceae bacterium]
MACLGLLALTLAVAIARPRGIPEAAVAVPAAAVCLASGLESTAAARTQLRALAPTLAFLAAVLVLARLCEIEGVFDWAGSLLARSARNGPVGLLGWVVAIAFAVTTVLSLDATVVLFTPVVLATAARAGVRARPHLHATLHVANSGSLLLPVSNLTNLLAFHAADLSVARFAALMALPTLAVLAVEYAGARWCFAGDLRTGGGSRAGSGAGSGAGGAAHAVRPPRWALAVLGTTLAGFLLSSPTGVPVAIVAGGGAVLLGARRVVDGTVSPGRLAAWLDPAFLLFVAALAVLVDAVSRRGLGQVVRQAVHGDRGLLGLFVLATVAALLANLVNNLPAVLLLLPAAAPAGPGAVLATLIGVNVGPNLTYVGSLATLLWLRVTRAAGVPVSLAAFTRHALCTVAPGIAAATAALWLGLRLIGG